MRIESFSVIFAVEDGEYINNTFTSSNIFSENEVKSILSSFCKKVKKRDDMYKYSFIYLSPIFQDDAFQAITFEGCFSGFNNAIKTIIHIYEVFINEGITLCLFDQKTKEIKKTNKKETEEFIKEQYKEQYKHFKTDYKGASFLSYPGLSFYNHYKRFDFLCKIRSIIQRRETI